MSKVKQRQPNRYEAIILRLFEDRLRLIANFFSEGQNKIR
jgi:hypothetical protein